MMNIKRENFHYKLFQKRPSSQYNLAPSTTNASKSIRLPLAPKTPLKFGQNELKIPLRYRIQKGLKETRKVLLPSIAVTLLVGLLFLLVSPAFTAFSLLAIGPVLLLTFIEGFLKADMKGFLKANAR